LVVALTLCSTALAADKKPAAPAADAKPTAAHATQTLRGKVVWLEDALKRRYGVSTEPDAAHSSVVLETADGQLVPIVPDTRGRAFALDERLRDVSLELLVRRYEKTPLVQVIRVRKPTDKGLVEIDYWCDVCAIPMYTLKACECCQGPTRLRERPVEEVFEP
jgi:hypothetical protein